MPRSGPFESKNAGVVAAFLVRPVVAGEDDERVARQAVLLEAVDGAADVAVHAPHHGGEVLLLLRPVLAGKRALVGHLHAVVAGLVVGVGNRVRQVEEERAFLRAVDERQRLLRKEVVTVLFPLAGDAHAAGVFVGDNVRQRHPLAVSPQERGPVVVGVALVGVPEEVVEPLFPGGTGGVVVAQAPLADTGGGIAGRLEEFGHGHAIGFEPLALPHRGGVTDVQARHQREPRRGAHGRASVMLREADALGSQAVEAGRLQALLAVAAEVAVAEVVGQDEDDVRFACGPGSGGRSGGRIRGQGCCHRGAGGGAEELSAVHGATS